MLARRKPAVSVAQADADLTHAMRLSYLSERRSRRAHHADRAREAARDRRVRSSADRGPNASSVSRVATLARRRRRDRSAHRLCERGEPSPRARHPAASRNRGPTRARRDARAAPCTAAHRKCAARGARRHRRTVRGAVGRRGVATVAAVEVHAGAGARRWADHSLCRRRGARGRHSHRSGADGAGGARRRHVHRRSQGRRPRRDQPPLSHCAPHCSSLRGRCRWCCSSAQVSSSAV